jgi:hypothetical protein
MDHYYLNLKPNHFYLWNHFLDDQRVPWKWEWSFLSYATKCQGDLKAISTYMLLDFWKKECKFQGLDHYHFIGNTGLLNVEDIQAVAREIW